MARKKSVAPSSAEGALILKPDASVAVWGEHFDPSLMLGAQGSGGGVAPFLSLEGGVINDGQNEVGSELDVVILAAAVERTLYTSAYVKGTRNDPVCFYVGPEMKNAKPDPASPVPQHPTCAGCPKDAFGSSPIPGRKGKACGERARLLVLAMGDNDHPSEAPLRRLRIPATSLKFLDAYVSKVLALRPIQSVVTTITVTPDKGDQFHVAFKPRGFVDASLASALAARYEEGKLALLDGYKPTAKQGTVEAKTGRRVVKR